MAFEARRIRQIAKAVKAGDFTTAHNIAEKLVTSNGDIPGRTNRALRRLNEHEDSETAAWARSLVGVVSFARKLKRH